MIQLLGIRARRAAARPGQNIERLRRDARFAALCGRRPDPRVLRTYHAPDLTTSLGSGSRAQRHATAITCGAAFIQPEWLVGVCGCGDGSRDGKVSARFVARWCGTARLASGRRIAIFSARV